MKASAFVVLALAAGTASAAQPWIMSSELLTAVDQAQTRASNSVVFSSMAGPYQGFAASAGMGFEDYNSTLPGGTAYLQSMRFVGGVTTAGTQIRVEFYDSTATFINSFSLALPSAGNSIWSIGLESVANAKDSTFLIPEAGYMQIVAVSGTGQWLLSTTAPSVGTSSLLDGDTTTHTHNFELTIPAPSSLALLGLGGLVVTRRRR